MHTILRGRATGAPHRVDSGTSGKDSGDRLRSKARNDSSPLVAKNALSQSQNSTDRSRRFSLNNTPGFSLPRSPNRISFMCLRKMRAHPNAAVHSSRSRILEEFLPINGEAHEEGFEA